MAWVLGIAIFLALSFSFPKQMGTLALVLGAVVALFLLHQWNEERQKDKVILSVSYDLERCGKGFPLFLSIKNNSRKTVLSVTLYFEATRKGYSNNLVNSGSRKKANKILKRGESHTACYFAPKLKGLYAPQSLVWSVQRGYINFDD